MSGGAAHCVFCEIVAGREIASKVYEDDRILAFLTLSQTNPGEFQLIPKAHIDHFTDLNDELAQHILLHAQRLARRAKPLLRAKRMGYVVHGFGVAHAHLVVVPLHRSDDITSAKFARIEDGRVTFGLSHLPRAKREELDQLAKLLAAD